MKSKRQSDLALMAESGVLSAPAHLSASAAEWWLVVMQDWPLEEHHRRLLTLAAVAWGRCQQARGESGEAGLRDGDRSVAPGPRQVVASERASRFAYARLVGELDLDAAPTPGPLALRPRRK